MYRNHRVRKMCSLATGHPLRADLSYLSACTSSALLVTQSKLWHIKWGTLETGIFLESLSISVLFYHLFFVSSYLKFYTQFHFHTVYFECLNGKQSGICWEYGLEFQFQTFKTYLTFLFLDRCRVLPIASARAWKHGSISDI